MPTFIHDGVDVVSWIGLIISVVGAILTVCTLVTARGIRAKLMRRFQLPQMIKDIQDSLTDLSRMLTDPTFDPQALKILIRRVSVTLKNAHEKTRSAEVARALTHATTLLAQDSLTKGNGNTFYLEMTGAHQELSLEKRDDQWNV